MLCCPPVCPWCAYAALSCVPSWGWSTGQDPASVTPQQDGLGSFRHRPDAGGCSPAIPTLGGTGCCPASLQMMGFVALGLCLYLEQCQTTAISSQNPKPDPLERARGTGGRRERAEAFWGVTPRAASPGPSPPSAWHRVEVRGHPRQVGAFPRRVRPACRGPRLCPFAGGEERGAQRQAGQGGGFGGRGRGRGFHRRGPGAGPEN